MNLKKYYKQLPTGMVLPDKTLLCEGDILDFDCWQNGNGERGIIEYHPNKAAFCISFYNKWGGEGCEYLSLIYKPDYKYLKKTVLIGSIYNKRDIKRYGVSIKCD